MVHITTHVAPLTDQADTVLSLCNAAFGSFSPAYLLDRLPTLDTPVLHLAHGADGNAQGFKLGYRRGDDLLYSWLGAVHPRAAGQGLGMALMTAQHEWARSQGYRFVETRTRAANNRMIMLNLRAGFTICGFELDRSDIPVVIQRKAL
jgi:GNAT superfamily N-acetyltransferase